MDGFPNRSMSFLPLRVMPHVHALVDCHDFGEEHVERLRLHLTNWRNQYGEPLDLVPDIDVRPISTPRSLLDRTRYLYKPINLASRYDAAWEEFIDDDRTRAWELNSQARELAAGVTESTMSTNTEETTEPQPVNRLAALPEVPTTPEPPTKPTIRTVIEQIDGIRDALRSTVRHFGEVVDALRVVEKDRKTTDKEIEVVREKLRALQNVSL